LTSLYVVKVSVHQLDVLRSCHDILAWAEETGDTMLADVLSALQRAPEDQGKHLLDSFRQVLAVMEFRAAPILVASLERVTLAGPEAPVVATTLDADQYTAYRELCDQIVYALSTGDQGCAGPPEQSGHRAGGTGGILVRRAGRLGDRRALAGPDERHGVDLFRLSRA
jgi:hypothetical protein